jgi:DNA-binding XRE family transcriptional regulator
MNEENNSPNADEGSNGYESNAAERLGQLAQSLIQSKPVRVGDYDLEFASRVRIAIRESNYVSYNQTELAKLCGIKQTTFSSWFIGLRKPEIDTGVQFCKVFNCSFEWLYTGRGQFRPLKEKESDQLTLRLLKTRPSYRKIVTAMLDMLEAQNE